MIVGCVFETHLNLELLKKNGRQKNKFGLVGGFIGYVENLVIVWWNSGIQLT